MIQPAFSGRSRGVLAFFYVFLLYFYPAVSFGNMQPQAIQLNPPVFQEKDFPRLLKKRYSCRKFKDQTLKLDDLGSVLWAAGGKKFDAVSEATRTIPSAGARYPLELYLVIGRNCTDKLTAGIYHYLIDRHALELVKEGDLRAELASACLGQGFISQTPASLVIVAEFGRTTARYGARGEHYVYIEAGHASQNAYLAIYSLGLATVEVGAFSDTGVSQALSLSEGFIPLIIMPVGYP